MDVSYQVTHGAGSYCYPRIGMSSFTVSSPWEEYNTFSVAAVPIFVLPGTHYCCVARGGVDSKLSQD